MENECKWKGQAKNDVEEMSQSMGATGFGREDPKINVVGNQTTQTRRPPRKPLSEKSPSPNTQLPGIMLVLGLFWVGFGTAASAYALS